MRGHISGTRNLTWLIQRVPDTRTCNARVFVYVLQRITDKLAGDRLLPCQIRERPKKGLLQKQEEGIMALVAGGYEAGFAGRGLRCVAVAAFQCPNAGVGNWRRGFAAGIWPITTKGQGETPSAGSSRERRDFHYRRKMGQWRRLVACLKI